MVNIFHCAFVEFFIQSFQVKIDDAFSFTYSASFVAILLFENKDRGKTPDKVSAVQWDKVGRALLDRHIFVSWPAKSVAKGSAPILAVVLT